MAINILANIHPLKRRNSLCLALLLLASIGTQTRAEDFITNPGTGTVYTSGGGNTDNVVGWRITVGALPLEVTALGTYDANADGISTPILVGLWRASDSSLLASVTIPAGTSGTLDNSFRYTTLGTPLILQASTTYTFGQRLGAQGYSQVLDGETGATSASNAATFVYYRMNDNTGVNGGADPINAPLNNGEMPNQNLGGSAPILGPNFQFIIVPEPSTWALLGLGSAGLGVLLLRRRAARA